MSEETMLTIKTKLDTDGFDDLEKQGKASLDDLQKDINKFNRDALVKPDTDAFRKELKDIDKELDKLGKERKVVLSKPKTEETKKELAAVEKKLKDLERKREIKIEFDKQSAAAIEKSITNIVIGLTALTVAGIAAAAAVIGFGNKAANALDNIDKQSQKLSMTTDTFQEFSYIAKQSGTSVEALSGAMTTLTRKAANNSKGFKALGISVKDSNGNLKNQETLLKETITALQGVESGTARSRVAYELFGMRAKELEPLLNAGANSMENLRKEAHEFGLVLDKETIAKGAAANDAFGKMSATLKNVLIVALAGALPYITDFYEGIANWAKEIAPLAQNLVPMLANALDALVPIFAGLATYVTTYAIAMAAVPIATAAASIATFTFAGAIQALTAAMALNPIGAIAVALAALVTAIVWAVKNWEYLVAQMIYGAKSIYVALFRTFTLFESVAVKVFETVHTTFYNMMREIVKIALSSVQSLLDSLGQLPGSLGEPFREGAERVREFNRAVSDGLRGQVEGIQNLAAARIAENDRIIAEHDAELKRIGEERDAKLAALEDTKKKQRELDKEAAAPGGMQEVDLTAFKKGEEDKIAALKARYAAQREIAAATITDQEELTDALTGLEKAYYTELEKLTRENYEKQVAQGKALTDAQILELSRIIQKNKELATQEGSLQLLEQSYNTRVSIAKKTINEEKKLEDELMNLRKQFLQQKLNLLIQEAETAKKLRGEIKEDTLAAIREVKKELDSMQESNMAKNVSDQISQWGGLLNNMASNLGDFMSAQYDARIQALDKTLERELRMLENAFEQQNALFEEQLKQYENLEERRTEIQDEYNDARERLNWKAQEHVTEDEYLAIMAQMAQEEEKYNESMMRLEEDTLKRDEIRLQQEQAEQDYLARKEQLEKEYAIKRAQMERKQAQSQQAQAIFSAFIFTAAGVARALAEFIWPLNIAVGAIVAAAGAVQIAAIASRPLPSIPSYHIGGIIGGANIQDYGHLPGPDNPHDKTLFWGQEGETVLPIAESKAYQYLRAHGHNLQGLADRITMTGAASLTGAAAVASVDNSRVVTHSQTYYVDKEPSFAEKRRQQKMLTRAWVRGLA